MGTKFTAGVNDMATTNPELAAQWHPTRNGAVTPRDVMAGTGKKFWWVCSKGHEWEAKGYARVSGAGCPVCAGQVTYSGINDMATTNPELAAQWHPTRNGAVTPRDVMAGSGKKFWWVCSKGHEWQLPPNGRYRGAGCPFCSGHFVWPGFNDLATTNPELAAQWHPTKNGALTPREVSAGTYTKVWWLCSRGHDWKASGTDRRAGDCPYCSGHRVWPGFNDLATTNPELLSQWHPTKNGAKKPQEYSPGSSARIWWKCSEGHVWQSVIASRAKGIGCPTCATYGFDPNKPAVLYFIANKALGARKVGITNVGTGRLAAFAKAGWHQVYKSESSNGQVVMEVETSMFRWLRKELGMPQHLGKQDMQGTAGATETFSEDGPSDYEVIQRIKAEFARREE